MTSPWLSFALLGFLLGPVGAQIGIDQCACFPSIYTFVLDLGQTCDDTSLPSSGIESTTCSVLPSEPGAVLSSLIPVSVSEITVLELGQNLGTILTEQIPGDTFTTGTTFLYFSSSVGSQEGLDTSIASGTFPRGLELQLRGRNLFNEIIDNRFTIVFRNECDIFPVVEEGDQIGWVTFAALADPIDEVCPMAAPTIAPTMAPTFTLTMAPTSVPISSPTLAPTSAPTNAPGQATTIELSTLSPTSAPTLAPTSSGQPSNGQLPFIPFLAVASVAMALL
jgi:hypothetical protein